MTRPIYPQKPEHTDRLADTDLYIKSVAMAADARFASYTRYSVLPVGYQVTVNSNSDAVVSFPGIGTIAGCIITPINKRAAPGVVTQVPSGGPVAFILGGGWVQTLPWNVATGVPGQVYIRCMISPFDSNHATYPPGIQYAPRYGAQACAPGQVLSLRGIAWGPA